MARHIIRETAPVLLIVLMLAAASAGEVSAQCCTAGNPVNASCETGMGSAGQLSATWSYLYSESDAYYRGTQRLDKTYAESNYDFSSLALSYSISDRLRLTADVGYFFDKAQRFVASDYTRYARGVSDATLGVSYGTWSSDDGLFDLVQSARVTIPVGAFDQQYDGVVLPIDFQPSSGNYRYNLGMVFSRRFEDSDFALLSHGAVEFSQAIETANTYHRYGNLYLASLAGSYRISELLQAFVQLRYEIRDRALTGPRSGASAGQYTYLNSSGGVLGYIAPQLTLSLPAGLALSLQYSIPFHRNIYGDEQLTNRHSFAVNLTRLFNFGSDEMTEEYSPEDRPDTQGLAFVEISVRGNCSMCRDRIEAVALAQARVQAAEWDGETETLRLYYRDDRPDLDAVGSAIAAAGHDNGTHTAPDEVYNDLPDCCHYRD